VQGHGQAVLGDVERDLLEAGPPRRNVPASSESAYSRHSAGALRSDASSVSRTIISATRSGAAALSTRGCVAAAASRAARAGVKNSSRSSPSRALAADRGPKRISEWSSAWVGAWVNFMTPARAATAAILSIPARSVSTARVNPKRLAVAWRPSMAELGTGSGRYGERFMARRRSAFSRAPASKSGSPAGRRVTSAAAVPSESQRTSGSKPNALALTHRLVTTAPQARSLSRPCGSNSRSTWRAGSRDTRKTGPSTSTRQPWALCGDGARQA
jgi:hypothetical protein